MLNIKSTHFVPLFFAAMGLLGTLGAVGWFYSTIQVDSVMSEMRRTLQTLEIELEMLRKDSCAPRHRAGPFGSLKPVAMHSEVIPEEAATNPVLAALLKELAVDKEIIVVLANEFACKMLKVQLESVRRVGIPNYMAVALDKPAAEFCMQHHIPVYERFGLFDPQTNTIPIPISMILSGLKFHVLREFLVLGYNVLVSDVDIVFLQNPLHHLYRDSDFEGTTDGYTNSTAYGYLDVFDDPPMGPCHITLTPRLWSFNSGLFYLRATIPAIGLLDRVYHRVSKQPLWDQAVFNEELMYPSRPGYEGLQLSKRIMDYLLFMNSKTLFSEIRGNQRYAALRPVIVHLNYHKTKVERMEAVVDYYVNGNRTALDPFPVGDPV